MTTDPFITEISRHIWDSKYRFRDGDAVHDRTVDDSWRRIARSLADVDASQWNALTGGGTPFLRHEFLLALEESGCATTATGWDARHVLHFDAEGRLAGAMPLYLKPHSWGEFVFDFAWAEAYHLLGLSYYPRLVSAVPFTPATGDDNAYFAAGGPFEYEKLDEMIHTLQPDAVIHNNPHAEPLPGEDVQGFEQDLPGQNTASFNTTTIFGLPMEVCMTINDSWGVNDQDENHKSTQHLIRTLARAASVGANYLLNVGPTALGEILPVHVERLQAIGD